MNEVSSPPKRAAFGPVARRVETAAFGRRPDGPLPSPDRAAGGPSRSELHSSTVLYAAAAIFAISATVAGLLAGGTLLPHHASDVRLELRGTLSAEDGATSR